MIWLTLAIERIRRYPLAAVLAAAALVLFAAGLARSCRTEKPVPGIDLQTIERINSANEQERREAVREVIRRNEEIRSLDDEQIRAIERRIEDASRIERKRITGEDLERILRENQ